MDSYFDLFSDIISDRQSGASSIAEKLITRIKDFCQRGKHFSEDEILSLLSFAKSVRPTMVIVKNSVLLLESKVISYLNELDVSSRRSISSEKIFVFADEVLRVIKKQKEEVIRKGIEIIRNFESIGVVSFSSSLKSILDLFPHKKIFFLKNDFYARRLKDVNAFPVSEEELPRTCEIGLMGADAIVISEKMASEGVISNERGEDNISKYVSVSKGEGASDEGEKIWEYARAGEKGQAEGKSHFSARKIVNGFPSKRFVEILSSYGRKIFVLAEKLKFTKDDIPLEEGFDEIQVDEAIAKNLVIITSGES